MSDNDSSRARSGSQPAFKSSVMGAIRSAKAPGSVEVGLEVLSEPLVEPERQVAVCAAEQGVGRLVSQVFGELRARVGVDDSLVALCQEEGSPLRQLGIIELQKVDEGISIVEDVDFDWIVALLRVEIEMLGQVALECLQAQKSPAGSSFSGKLENRMKPAGADLVTRGDQRLGLFAQGSAAYVANRRDTVAHRASART